MGLFEGKTPSERNKIIAAAILGVVSIFALYFAFGRSLFSSGTTTATAKSSPTPKSGISVTVTRPEAALPTVGEQDFYYQTTAVYYPGTVSAPDPGRNIFAFYEPPIPCKGDNCPPSPIPSPTPMKSPTPVPPPPILLASLSPQTVYAGSKTFRMELNGDKFTPDSRVYFNQSELPTAFITAQRISVEIPTKLVASEGSPQVIVQTPDGKLFSNQLFMTVQAAPRPTLLYIGMIGRKRFNNDTAYFTDSEKSPPYGARLNDVLSGRFRLIDMSSAEATLEDTTLGFKYRIPISKGIAIGSMPPGRGTDLGAPGIPTYNPGFVPPSDIPGIPNNIQRYNPSAAEEEKKKLQELQKQDVDDEGDN